VAERGNDEPRLLSRQSQYGYTNRTGQALFPDAGEAVPEDVQAEFSRQAGREWAARRRAAWDSTNRTILGALDAFEETIVGDPPLVHALRAVRRSTAAVSRRVGSR
jgi:hypothetical protein